MWLSRPKANRDPAGAKRGWPNSGRCNGRVPQRRRGPIVSRTMRSFSPLLVLLALGACVRAPLTISPEPQPGPPPENTAPSGVPVVIEREASVDVEYLRERRIIVPVAGVSGDRLEDTFDSPRDGGRLHRALDILAPRGTPVLSADDGRVLRLSTSTLGGITIYAVDPAGRIVYYYAHLDHYRDGLAAGMTLAKGDTIGFVGTTGNAPKDTPHLHFQIMRMPSDGRYWYGDPIDPYPLIGGRTSVAGGGKQ